MTFADVLSYLRSIPSKDVFGLLNDLEGGLVYLADKWNIPAMVFYIVGIAAAVVIGLACFKLIKPALVVTSGFFGMMVGAALFYALWSKAEWMPEWLCYIFCIVLAAIFICLTLAKPTPALALYAGLLGYVIMSFYLPGRMVGIGAAFVVALLTALLPRTVCIFGSGFACGILSVSFLSMILPKVEALQLGSGWLPMTIAMAVALVYVLVQYASNRYRGESI